ncbi:type VII secretion target [Kitasatospora sp. NPDC092948]|uniref:type VII secretion target n=1 Tax=Kitasatospora sp. NPDC092948 TaxID=3364088 RepID=UPI0037F6B805
MSDVSGNGMSGFVYNAVNVAEVFATQAMVADSQARALNGQVGSGAMKVEVENLQTFKNKVDQILSDLDGSPASHGEVSQQTLTPGQLGQNFGQVGDLMTAYTTVHTNLEQLSQSLAAQITAMSASIGQAAGNYSNSEAEQQSRFSSISYPGALPAPAAAGDPRTAYTARPQAPSTGTQQGAY